MKCYNLVNDMKAYNLNEIVDLIKQFLKGYDDFNLMENNLNVILKGFKNYIDNVTYDDDNLYINLNCTGLFNINDDFKNYPLMSFYSERIVFKLNSTIIMLNDYMYLNICDNNISIKNIKRIE